MEDGSLGPETGCKDLPCPFAHARMLDIEIRRRGPWCFAAFGRCSASRSMSDEILKENKDLVRLGFDTVGAGIVLAVVLY